ncbi:MAG: LysE family translocator [Candidatus Limnocylindrales bacterium]
MPEIIAPKTVNHATNSHILCSTATTLRAVSQAAFLGFMAVSVAVIIVPGPSVVFAVGRALTVGRRDALLTVLGNASGIFVQVLLVAFGLGVALAGSDLASGALKLVSAAYLTWLGVSAIRHRHSATAGLETTVRHGARPWRAGFIVGISNPKTLVLLATLLPGYVDLEAGLVIGQMLLLGALFCLTALVSDGAWATLAAGARPLLAGDPRRLAWASVAGGLLTIAVGLLLLAA